MENIKVYLIARISEDAHLWNTSVCSKLKPPIEVFMPQEHNPWTKRHELFSLNTYLTDVNAMKDSDIGLILPEFGSDCSYEVGWYSNTKKPVVAFLDTQMEWLRNWMVKGGIDLVVTKNKQTHVVLEKDNILKHKELVLIESFDELNDVLKKVYVDYYENKREKKPVSKP